MTLSSLYVLLYVLLLLFMLTYKEMGFTGTFSYMYLIYFDPSHPTPPLFPFPAFSQPVSLLHSCLVLVFGFGSPVSLIKVAYRSTADRLSTEVWASCLWLHH